MSFKDISHLELWRPFCSLERNCLVEDIMSNNSVNCMCTCIHVVNSLRLGEGDVSIYFHTYREMCTPMGGKRASLGYVRENGPVQQDIYPDIYIIYVQ